VEYTRRVQFSAISSGCDIGLGSVMGADLRECIQTGWKCGIKRIRSVL